MKPIVILLDKVCASFSSVMTHHFGGGPDTGPAGVALSISIVKLAAFRESNRKREANGQCGIMEIKRSTLTKKRRPNMGNGATTIDDVWRVIKELAEEHKKTEEAHSRGCCKGPTKDREGAAKDREGAAKDRAGPSKIRKISRQGQWQFQQ